MNRNFLITGATSEIGHHLAKDLVKNHNNVRLLLASRKYNADLDGLQSDFVKYLHGMDLLMPENCAHISQECEATFDGPFSIVHSVGDFWDHVPFPEIDAINAQHMMNSHYITLYGLLQALIPLLIKNGGGKILAFSCNSVRHNYPYMVPFTAAKAAVEALIKCIAHEYAKYGIVANALALSSVQTEAVRQSKPHGDFDHYIHIDSLTNTILDVLSSNTMINGNIINCYTYSESFYNSGYFQRIKQP